MRPHLHRIATAGLGALAAATSAIASCPDEMAGAETEALYMSYRSAETNAAAAAIASCLLTRDFGALGLIGADAAMLRADFADALAENGELDRAVTILTELADRPAGDGPAAEYARLPALIQLAALEAERERFDAARRYIDRAVAAAEAASDPEMRAAVRWPLQVRLEIENARLAVAAPDQAPGLRNDIAETQSEIEAIDDRLLSRRQRLGLLTGAPAPAQQPGVETRFADVSVFFATPRARTAHGSPTGGFSFEHGSLNFGRALVSAPYAPALSSIAPRMHVSASTRTSGLDAAMLDDVIVLDDDAVFADQLRRTLTAHEGRELLVYAAPALMRFEDAATHAAELALALEIEGAAAVYAPALRASESGVGASTDDDFAAFIRALSVQARAEHVFIVAHADAAAQILSSDFEADNLPPIRLAALARSDEAAALSRLTPTGAGLERVVIYTPATAQNAFELSLPDETGIDVVALPLGDGVARGDALLQAALNDLRAVFWFSAPTHARCMLSPTPAPHLWREASAVDGGCAPGRFQLAATALRRLGPDGARAQVDEQIAAGENAAAWREVREIIDALAAASEH